MPSDFSDDDLPDLEAVAVIMLLAPAEKKKRRKKRNYWVRPWISRRDNLRAYTALLQELQNEDVASYTNFLRMNRVSFNELLERVSPFITKSDTAMRSAIPPGEKLAVVLRFLATDSGILIRLHWEAYENYTEALSTITLHQGETSTTLQNPKNAVALATNNLILREFASDMFGMHNARLVMIQYPPLVMTFQHEDDSNESMFSEASLHGMLKGLLSQCAPSEKYMEFSFIVNKATKSKLPRFSFCQCLSGSSRSIHHSVSRSRKATTTADTSCQTVTSSNFKSNLLTVNDGLKNADTNFSRQIEEKFIAVEKELKEHREFMESQLSDQRKQNEEMKSLLLCITENVTKRNMKDDKKSSGHILDAPNLNQSSLESGELMTSDPNVIRIPKIVQAGTESINMMTPNDNWYNRIKDHAVTEKQKEQNRKHTMKTKQRVKEEQTINIGEETLEQSRKGPVLKEIVGSLPTTRTKAEMKHETSREKTPPLKVSYSYPSSLTDTRDRSFNEVEASTRSTAMQRKHDITYRPNQHSSISRYHDNSRTDTNEDFFRVGYESTERTMDSPPQSQTHTSLRYGSYRNAKYTLVTRPDGRDGTRRVLANQTGFSDEYGMDDMMYGGSTSLRNTYSDLQTNEMNFPICTKYSQAQAGNPFHGNTTVTKTRISDGDDRIRVLIDCMIGDNTNRERLWESVDDALLEDKSSVPYVDTVLDTVICLDTSESIKEVFPHMKNIALDFINGIEDVAEEKEIEENIGIVTFGGRARIVHHLSNDYGSVRDAIDDITPGGPSPLLEGAFVSMVCLSKGGELNIKNCVRLPPRLIILTDGIATAELPETSPDTKGVDKQLKMTLTSAFENLRMRQPEDALQVQVTVIPVGQSDKSFLLSLVKACGGSLVEAGNVKKLCNHQRFHRLAGDALGKIRRKYNEMTVNLAGLHTLGIYTGLEEEDEWPDIRDIVQDNLSKAVIQYGTIYTFDNIHEVPSLPPLGTRVARGVDWVWGNQDTEGAGTIFNHGFDGQYMWVLWDNALSNVNRYGKDNCFDVQVVTDQPRQPKSIDFSVGLQVERGPSWHLTYGNQDGGQTSRGVIIREKPEVGRVKVRWQNGKMYEYRHGENNAFDLSVIDPLACLLESTAKP